MTHHVRSTLLQTLIASLQTPTSKNKLSSFKSLAQFLAESSYENLILYNVGLDSITSCVVQCMSEEVKKIECSSHKQFSAAPVKCPSLTLLNFFESLVKCLTHYYYVYEPHSALPLMTHILTVLQQKISTTIQNTFILWHETYFMSLAVLIELESFVQILPTYLIPTIARVLLQTNQCTKTVTSLSVEKKIQLCLLLLRKDEIQQRQNLFLAIFTRIVSCIIVQNEDYRTTAWLPNLNLLCHSLHDTILRHPFNFLDMLYLCPKLWIALHILIQSWNTLNATARVNLIKMMHRILKYFQLPTFIHKTFQFSTYHSCFLQSPLQLLFLPIKEILLRHVSCLLSNPQYEESLHCDSFQSLNAMSSVLKILNMQPDIFYPHNNFSVNSTRTDFLIVLDLLSDILIEIDLLKEEKTVSFNESLTSTNNFFQLLEELQNNTELHPLMVSVISALVIRKFILRSIDVSNETFQNPFVNNLLHSWMECITQNVSCFKQKMRHDHSQSTFNSTQFSQDVTKTGEQSHHSPFAVFWITTALTEFLCWCVVSNLTDTSTGYLTASLSTNQLYISRIHELCSCVFGNLASQFLLSTAKDQSNLNSSVASTHEMSHVKNTLQCWYHFFYIVLFLSPEATLIDFVKHQLETNTESLPSFRKLNTENTLTDSCLNVTAKNQHIWILLILRLFSHEFVLMDQLKNKLCCSILKNVSKHTLPEFRSLLLFFMQLYYNETTFFLQRPANEQTLPHSFSYPCASLPCLLEGKCHTIHSKLSISVTHKRLLFQHKPILHPYFQQWMMQTIQCITPDFHWDLLNNRMNPIHYEKDKWVQCSIRLLRLCMFVLKVYPSTSTNTFFSFNDNPQQEISFKHLLTFLHEIVLSLYIPEFETFFQALAISKTFFHAFLQPTTQKRQNTPHSSNTINTMAALQSFGETHTSHSTLKQSPHLCFFSPFLFNEYVHFLYVYVTDSNRPILTFDNLEFLFANANFIITTFKLFITISDCLLNGCDIMEANSKDTHMDFLYFENEPKSFSFTSETDQRGLSTSDERVPLTSDKRGPSTSDERGPSTSDERGPTRSDERGPSTSDERGPSTSDERVPSTSDERGPTRSDERGPTRSDQTGPFTLTYLNFGPLLTQCGEEFAHIFTTLLYLWYKHPQLVEEHLCFFLTRIDKIVSSLNSLQHQVWRCQTILKRIQQMVQSCYTLYSCNSDCVVQNSYKILILREFLFSLIQIVLDKASDWFQQMSLNVCNSFQALWSDCINFFSLIVSPLHWKEKEKYCLALFSRECQQSNFTKLVELSCRGKRPHIILGLWQLSSVFTTLTSQSGELNEIMKTVIEPQITRMVTLYKESLVNLQNGVCSTFENLNLLLTLGHKGLFFVMDLFQEKYETSVLELLEGMMKPTSLHHSLVQRSNALNELLARFCVNDASQVDKTTIWNLMWYHYKVLPILQCAACLFFCQSKECFRIFFMFLNVFPNEGFQPIVKDPMLSNCVNAHPTFLADFGKILLYYCHKILSVFVTKSRTGFLKQQDCQFIQQVTPLQMCRMIWNYATYHDEVLRLDNIQQVVDKIQLKYFNVTQKLVSCKKELLDHISRAANDYFLTFLCLMISKLPFKTLSETRQFFVSANWDSQDKKRVSVTIFLGFLLKYPKNESILVTLLECVKKEWNQSIPFLYFLLLSNVMKLYGSDSTLNLNDLLSSVISVSTAIEQDALLHYFHPFVLIYSIYEAKKHISQSLDLYFHWLLNQFISLPFSSYYCFNFQYLFACILRYATLPENCLLFECLVHNVARCVSQLANEATHCLLDPSNIDKTHDTMLLLPWSPYWVLGEALVALLSSMSVQSSTMYETSDDQRNVWITSSIWSFSTDSPPLSTDALLKVKPLFLILQTFLERQHSICLKKERSQNILNKNDCTVPSSLLRHFGFEPVFLFPPLQKLSLTMLPKLLTSLVELFHKVIIPQSDASTTFQPLLQPQDIRHTLIAITLNHTQRTFSTVFQKRYVMHVFSWLLFFYDATNETDPLLTLILKTSSHVCQMSAQFCGCSKGEQGDEHIFFNNATKNQRNNMQCVPYEKSRFHFQLPFDFVRENVCYNISRQNFKCLVKSYVRLVNKVDLTCLFHSMQKNICLVLLLEFLSMHSEKCFVTLIGECFLCIHSSSCLFCLDPLNCSKCHFRALKYSLATGLPRYHSVQNEIPYPLWLNELVFTPSNDSEKPLMVLYEIQNALFNTSDEYKIFKTQTLRVDDKNRMKLSPQNVCKRFFKELQANYPTIIPVKEDNYKIDTTLTCFMEFPLLVWCYALCDHENKAALPKKTCLTLLENLCHEFLKETTHDDEAMLGMTLIICTIFLTKELVCILNKSHYNFLQKQQVSKDLKNGFMKTASKKKKEECHHVNFMAYNDKTLSNGLLWFLNQLCYKTFANICLNYLGLPMEAHMLIHLSSVYKPKECSSSFLQNHWICEHTCLIQSLSCLDICSRDAYHGHSWHSLSKVNCFKEAHVTQQHWRAMILRESLDTFPWQPLCRVSPFSWWHAAGLLKSFPFQQLVTSSHTSLRHDLRMEWLWRLAQWDDNLQLCPSTTFTSFHTSLYYSLESLHTISSKHACHTQQDVSLQKSLTHFVRQSLHYSPCTFNLLPQTSLTSLEKLMHHVVRNSLVNIYQHIPIHWECQSVTSRLNEWTNSLQCLNEYPSLFWLFEPLVAYQQNLLQILYNKFSKENKLQNTFFLSWITYQKYYYKLLHQHQFQDTCLTLGLNKLLRDAIPLTNCINLSFFHMFSNWLLVKTIYKSYDLQRAVVSCEPLLLRLQAMTLHDFTKQQAQLACTILSTLAVWKFNAQWDPFQKIERELFQPAIALADHYLDITTSKCHQHYAIVLDTIIQNSEKNQFSQQKAFETQLYTSHEQALHSTELQLEQMDVLCLPLKTSLVTEKFRLQALLTKEKNLLKTKEEYIQNLAIKAIQHYSIWLRYHPKISHQTLRSTCRILSLWFQYSHNSLQVTNVLHHFFETEKNCFLLPHFRLFLYQLVSRISGDDAKNKKRISSFTQTFQKTLCLIIKNLILVYPFHTFFSLVSLENGNKIPVDYPKKEIFSMTTPQMAAVQHLLKDTLIQASHEHLTVILDAIVHFTDFCIHLGHLRGNDIPAYLENLPNFKHVTALQNFLPVPTTLPYSNVPQCHYSLSIESHSLKKKRRLTKNNANFTHYIQKTLGFPTIYQFLPPIDKISSGLSQPKIISVIDTSGCLHKIIVKGRDDLRTDAVTEQLFHVLNSIFSSGRNTRERNLCLRTYNVIPLSPVVGLVQFVTATIPLGDFLTGPPEKDFCGMHTRYDRDALTSKEAKNLLHAARQNNYESLLCVYQKICHDIKPVMHQAFLNIFPSPFLWFPALQRYTKSVALGSMVGYLLGLGDRHTNNIMLDLHTGELIHIDFGILFDRGETLSIPEVVPFRLTRDIVNGLGPMALEGVFRATCELTLDVLRQMHSIVTSIVEVFLFDPLFIWSIQPSQFIPQHNYTKSNVNPQALTALYNVQKKNMGYLHQYTLADDDFNEPNPMCVSTLVDRLFRQATSEDRLCRMFVGWAPWL